MLPRALRLLLNRLPGVSHRNISASHYHALTALVRGADPSAHLDLPHGISADRMGDVLLLTVGGPVLPDFVPAPLPQPLLIPAALRKTFPLRRWTASFGSMGICMHGTKSWGISTPM